MTARHDRLKACLSSLNTYVVHTRLHAGLRKRDGSKVVVNLGVLSKVLHWNTKSVVLVFTSAASFAEGQI